MSNGQHVNIAAAGQFSIYRPKVLSFVPTANDIQWDSPLLTAVMSWDVTLESDYDGEYGITQLMLGTGFYYNTDGQYVLDGNTEIYGTPQTNGPSVYIANDPNTHTIGFLDTPTAPATPCVDMDIKFKDYIRFKPVGEHSIYITIAKNGWLVDASACLASGLSKSNCPPASGPVDSAEFPVWTLKRAGGGN